MADTAPRAPLSVYMLADHLDAALAAGEDLIARGQDWRTLAELSLGKAGFALAQRDLVEEVRSLELALTARILKARDHAQALASADKRFSQVARLFVSGTAILLDAVEECGDAREVDFETGDAVIAYVRGRGLIAPDAASVSHPSQFSIDDNFMVAKRLALGPVMDMAAAFLDALDTQYDLFAESAAGGRTAQAPASTSASADDAAAVRPERLTIN